MKALTIWQPWASLIAWGEKEYETRSWPTPYRGLLAVHAGKHCETKELLALNSFYRQVFERHGFDQNQEVPLPSGAVLCVVRLVDCCPTENLTVKAFTGSGFRISQKEEMFGDYSSGRFAWKLEVVEVFNPPIPAIGRQGLWEWSKP